MFLQNNTIIDDLIEDLISSAEISDANITVSEVKDFVPAFLNIVTKDEYVANILENLHDDVMVIDDSIKDEIDDLDEEYIESQQLGIDLTERKHNKLMRLLSSLFSKVIQVLSVIKTLDNIQKQEYFSWQSYVKNRNANQREMQYDFIIEPNQHGIKFTINKIGEISPEQLEISFTKSEIELCRESYKNILEEINVRKEISPREATPSARSNTMDFIKESMQNVAINSVNTPIRGSYTQNIIQKQQGNLWTDWQEIGRTQEGDKLTITMQSQCHSQGKHQSVPSLP